MRSASKLLIAILFVSLPAIAEPGKARWPIKTSVAKNAQRIEISYAKFIALPAPNNAAANNRKYQETRYPSDAKIGEGSIVTVKGYLHLVASEDDEDYHIQIAASPVDGGNCIIVEVPNPKFIKDTTLQKQAQAVRSFIRDRLLKGKEPGTSGNVMNHKPYVAVKGQLFFDDPHFPHNGRGKKGMKSGTIWEIHPITSMWFAKP